MGRGGGAAYNGGGRYSFGSGSEGCGVVAYNGSAACDVNAAAGCGTWASNCGAACDGGVSYNGSELYSGGAAYDRSPSSSHVHSPRFFLS